MNFDELYKDVPEIQKNALKAFRQNPPKELNGWTYFTLGQGEKTLLWLVGGLKRADSSSLAIASMTDKFRIIIPDYPAISSMDDLVDGISAILEAEAVEKAHVLSGSYGGMLAQVLLRRYPEKVNKLILSTTTAPNPSKIEHYQQLHDVAAAAPEHLLREFAPGQMFNTIAPSENEAAYFRAYLKELYGKRLNKDDILSAYAAIVDFMKKKFSVWDGDNIMIFKSDNDATFDEASQERLRALYPNAKTHTFSGAGHSPGSTQREAFFAKVREFFA